MDNAVSMVSDPSKLTTEAIFREIAALKELLFTRQDATEKAIAIAHEDLVRVPTEVQKAVGTLKDLHEEKLDHLRTIINEHASLRNERFASIQRQFEDWDRSTNLALDSQRQLVGQQNISAGQATAKSEASFAKQIDSLGEIFRANQDASTAKFNDLKERIDRIEGKGQGMNATWILILGAVTLVGALIAIFAAIR